MLNVRVDHRLSLRSLDSTHAASLLRVVDGNRSHLRRWLPWVQTIQHPREATVFIQALMSQAAQGLGFQFGVFYGETLSGMTGFKPIDHENRRGEIAYWLAENAQGQGMMLRANRSLLEIGFEQLHLNRMEIHIAVGNRRSRRHAERLGFTEEGILRQRECLQEGFVDHVVYALLADDYRRIS